MQLLVLTAHFGHIFLLDAFYVEGMYLPTLTGAEFNTAFAFLYAGDLEVPGGDMTLTSVTPRDLTFLFTGDWTTFDLGDPFTGDDFTRATGVLVTFETGEFLWGGDFIMLSFFEPFLPCCAGVDAFIFFGGLSLTSSS